MRGRSWQRHEVEEGVPGLNVITRRARNSSKMLHQMILSPSFGLFDSGPCWAFMSCTGRRDVEGAVDIERTR